MYRIIHIILLFLALLACTGYAVLCIGALLYDAPLGIVEDEIFAHIKLLSEGEKIYQPYGDGYVALIYNPLYYYVALPPFLINQSLPSIRIISILAIISSFIAVFRILRTLGVDKSSIIIALGLLACISPISGGPWEQVKVDGLMMALVLWAVYFMLDPKWRTSNVVIAGILYALAYYTKQTSLPLIVAGFIYIVFVKRDKIIPFILSFFSVFITIGGLLYLTNGEWFLFYTYLVPTNQHLSITHIYDDILYIWIGTVPVLIIFSIAGLYIIRMNKLGKESYILGFTYIASFITYVLPRCKYGGSIYNFLPFGILCCLLFGLTIGWISKENGSGEGKAVDNSRGKIIILGMIIAQFCLMAFNPISMLPNEGNMKMRNKVVQVISEMDGEIYMPVQSYYGYLGGKEMYSSFITITDVLNSGLKDSYPEDLAEKLENGEIKYVLSPRLNRPIEALRNKLPRGVIEKLKDRGMIVDLKEWKYNKNILYYPVQMFEVIQDEDNSAPEE